MKDTAKNLYPLYWEFALERIKKNHDEFFSNVYSTPGTKNRKDGYFGILDFSIACLLDKRLKTATVAVYLAKPEKEKVTNKAAFDHLYSHKDEIEKDLGAKLNWHRNSHEVSSKVTIILDNVSIDNKDDWEKMSRFHADWSKKFFDVIVPYLEPFRN